MSVDKYQTLESTRINTQEHNLVYKEYRYLYIHTDIQIFIYICIYMYMYDAFSK